MVLFAEEQTRTKRLKGEVKELNEAPRTKHNQTKEVIERASEELARAKLIKRGADRDLMQGAPPPPSLWTRKPRPSLKGPGCRHSLGKPRCQAGCRWRGTVVGGRCCSRSGAVPKRPTRAYTLRPGKRCLNYLHVVLNFTLC